LRLGMDVGPAVAGVIGRRTFSYDLWGDTVNVASRLDSHGVAGYIHVSDAVANRLRAKYVLDERGLVELKGVGQRRTWWLLQRAPQARPS